jgi:hypothetical protein
MIAALQSFGGNVKPQLLQQHMLNWQMKLFEYVITLLVPEELEGEALEGFRDFASFSNLAAQYNALQQSMEKKVLVSK